MPYFDSIRSYNVIYARLLGGWYVTATHLINVRCSGYWKYILEEQQMIGGNLLVYAKIVGGSFHKQISLYLSSTLSSDILFIPISIEVGVSISVFP